MRCRQRGSRWLLRTLWVWCWLAGSPLAGADETVTAQQLARQALQTLQAGQVRDACALYEQAYQRDPAPEYAYQIARLRDTLGEWDVAAPIYERWLDTGPDEDDRSRLRDQLSRSASAAAKEGDPDLAIRRLTLARSLGLRPDPELTRRLAVLLETRGRLGEALSLYRMALTEGHLQQDSLEATVQRLDDLLSSSAISIPDAQETDRLEVNNKPARLDENRQLQLPPGQHQIILRRPGFEPASVQVELSPGGKLTVEFNLVPEGGRAPGGPGRTVEPAARSWQPSVVTWTGLGLGVAALVGSGVAIGLAGAAYDEKNNCLRDVACLTSGQAREHQDQAQTWDTIALISGIGGGVVLAGAVAYWLLVDAAPRTGSPATAPATASWGPRPLIWVEGGGLLLQGRF